MVEKKWSIKSIYHFRQSHCNQLDFVTSSFNTLKLLVTKPTKLIYAHGIQTQSYMYVFFMFLMTIELINFRDIYYTHLN